jgi:hypothetical protein
MIKDFILPAAEDSRDEKLLADIDEYGLHILGIMSEEDEPEYAFSVGLYYSYSHPEIVIMGLNSNTAKCIINDIAELIENGATFEICSLYDEIVKGYPVAFIEVNISNYREYLGYANWFYSSLPSPYPALQMVWPDKEGKFPWQDGYDEHFRSLQPLLNAQPNSQH